MNKLYYRLPNFFQNILISLYNTYQYKVRHSGKYKVYREVFEKNKGLSLKELQEIQTTKFNLLLNNTLEKSDYYKKLYRGIEISEIKKRIDILPIVGKEEIRKNFKDVVTISEKNAVIRKTGGTTGKSMKVYFTKDNIQERSALLDNFRSESGYKLGKKTAWFSGKSLLTENDFKRNRYWKTDIINNIRFYSTFHVNANTSKHYLDNLKKFKPEFIVGFPSTLCDIIKYGNTKGIKFPKGIVKAIYPTAETITDEDRKIIENYFHSKVFNQYASSEGAPFIFECLNGKLHLELQSGIFEVLDSKNLPSKSGKLVVTSFTTFGTPLIRYDIGDEIELSNNMCSCGNNNPVVKKILGRVNDFIFSEETGRINLGNVSNSIKDVNGIIKFQVIQNELSRIEIHIVTDNDYSSKDEKKFLENIRDRVGSKIDVLIFYRDEIQVEKSGKFKIVKNNIKHLHI